MSVFPFDIQYWTTPDYAYQRARRRRVYVRAVTGGTRMPKASISQIASSTVSSTTTPAVPGACRESPCDSAEEGTEKLDGAVETDGRALGMHRREMRGQRRRHCFQHIERRKKYQ
jgi:hypothetical protein